MVLLIGMSLDILKQAQKVIFSRKRNNIHHPDIIVNRNLVKKLLPKIFGSVSSYETCKW